MRVALILASMSRSSGGIGLIARSQAFGLESIGVATSVFSLQDAFSQEDRKDWRTIPVHLSRVKGPSAFGYAPEFLSALEHASPDLLHVHGLWMYPGTAARTYARKNRKPLVITIHGMLESWALGNSRWKKKITGLLYERTNLRAADCIQVNTKAEMQSVRHFGLKNPIAVIPNGIDLPEDGDSIMEIDPPWKSWVQPDQKVLLFLSRVHPKKGLVNLLKAWSQLFSRKDASWILAIAGPDEVNHETELKNLCVELQIPTVDVREPSTTQNPSLLFLGPQYNQAKAACLRHADAFILPSFSEGFSMAVLEAAAARRPILLTPECNFPELVSAKGCLEITPTIEGCEAGLRQLKRMGQTHLAEMGQNAFDLVASSYTWPRVAEQMNEAYLWLLGEGKKPECVIDSL